MIKWNGREIAAFRLVYAQSAPEMDLIAGSLAKLLEEQSGGCPVCVSDAESVAETYELLIGPTNRSLSRKCYGAGGVAPMSYRLVVEGNSVQLACGGTCSATAFLSVFENLLVNDTDEDWNDGTYLETELTKTAPVPVATGSTLRVMTSNVLTHWWEGGRGYPSVAHRAEMYAATLNLYQPDLIGIQETDTAWLENLPYYLEQLKIYTDGRLDYEWIENTYLMPEGNRAPNLTSLIYLKSRFEKLESGILPYSYAVKETKYKCRTCTWGVYADRKSGEHYAVFNTHWSFTAEETAISIREELGVIRAQIEKYPNLHVFCTGDFNNHLNKSIEKFQVDSGFCDSKEEAKKRGCLVNENPGIPEGIYIDHVFFNEGVVSTGHATVDAAYAQKMSDHMMQYGDFALV